MRYVLKSAAAVPAFVSEIFVMSRNIRFFSYVYRNSAVYGRRNAYCNEKIGKVVPFRVAVAVKIGSLKVAVKRKQTGVVVKFGNLEQFAVFLYVYRLVVLVFRLDVAFSLVNVVYEQFVFASESLPGASVLVYSERIASERFFDVYFDSGRNRRRPVVFVVGPVNRELVGAVFHAVVQHHEAVPYGCEPRRVFLVVEGYVSESSRLKRDSRVLKEFGLLVVAL